jgi:hypothetical protein
MVFPNKKRKSLSSKKAISYLITNNLAKSLVWKGSKEKLKGILDASPGIYDSRIGAVPEIK